MKMKFLAFVALAASLAVVSCKGDKGELGPQGPQGQTGAQGPQGPAGKNSLTRTLAEPAGANCATGGAKIETGIDVNSNGTLDDGEVVAANTRYICNGATGNNTLTKTTVETAGGNCAIGGVKVEVGVDANKNGTLEASEVATAMTRYICNGATGAQSLIRTTPEAAGANCTYGGVKFETGVDADGNGVLDDAEVTTAQTKYVCNGAGAIYSNWIDVKVVPTDAATNADETHWQGKQIIAATALTADIVNKGIVLIYFKNSQGIVYPIDTDDVNPTVDIDGVGIFNVRLGYTYKEGALKLLVDDNNTRVSDSGAEIRYVLIPGLTPGRVTDLKKMSYEQVAKLYNIK